MNDIGRVILYHRKRIRISRDKLSRLANVSPSVIYDIEKGKNTVQMDSVMKLLHALNMSLDVQGPFVDEFNRKRANA